MATEVATTLDSLKLASFQFHPKRSNWPVDATGVASLLSAKELTEEAGLLGVLNLQV